MFTLLEVHDDDEFLYQVYASTRTDEFAGLGWPETQLRALLNMQFKAQKRSYDLDYPGNEQRIITAAGVKAGYIITSRSGNVLSLIFIALLPQFRNQGIGTAIIHKLQSDSIETGQLIRLHVLDNSPARALYSRLGFVEVGFKPPYVAMEWSRDN